MTFVQFFQAKYKKPEMVDNRGSNNTTPYEPLPLR